MINVVTAFVLFLAMTSCHFESSTAESKKNKTPVHKKAKHKKRNIKRASRTQKIEKIPIGLIDLTAPANAWDTFLTLRAFLADETIKAVIVKLQGEGDSLGGAFTIFNEIKYLARSKPVVAMIDESCLERCYYMAAGATKIIASPTASVGLIGAELSISRYTDLQLHDNDRTAHLNVTLVYQGAYKTMLNPNSGPLTPEQKKHAEEITQDLYEQFCADIAAARKLSVEHKEKWADGKYYTARYALKEGINLVDQTGSFSDALVLIKELLKEKGINADGEITLVMPVADQKSKSEEN